MSYSVPVLRGNKPRRDHFPWVLSAHADDGEALPAYAQRYFSQLAMPFELAMKWAWRVKEWKFNCDVTLDGVLDPAGNPAKQHAFQIRMKIVDGIIRPLYSDARIVGQRSVTEERYLPDYDVLYQSLEVDEKDTWKPVAEDNFLSPGGTYTEESGGSIIYYDLNVDPLKGYSAKLFYKFLGTAADAQFFLCPLIFQGSDDYPRLQIEDADYKPAFNFDNVGAFYELGTSAPFPSAVRHQPAFGLEDLVADPLRPDLYIYNLPVGDLTIAMPGEDDVVLPVKLTAVRQVFIGIGGSETPTNIDFYTAASGSFSMEATKFFTFENKTGAPVYDEDTGAQINDPLG